MCTGDKKYDCACSSSIGVSTISLRGTSLKSGGRIPDWDASGTIPACDDGDPLSRTRSPYSVSTWEFVRRFGSTAPRRRLLKGLLDYRAELNGAGITEGMQWIDGSFVEHVEFLKGRPPADIDLVLLFAIPCGHTQSGLLGEFHIYSIREGRERSLRSMHFRFR